MPHGRVLLFSQERYGSVQPWSREAHIWTAGFDLHVHQSTSTVRPRCGCRCCAHLLNHLSADVLYRSSIAELFRSRCVIYIKLLIITRLLADYFASPVRRPDRNGASTQAVLGEFGYLRMIFETDADGVPSTQLVYGADKSMATLVSWNAITGTGTTVLISVSGHSRTYQCCAGRPNME